MHLTQDDWRQLRALHEQGWALHWLHPNSKRPKGHDWQKGKRLSWDQFKAKYSPGDNVGVRLGSASHLGQKGFLAVIDCDIKDASGNAGKEMRQKLTSLGVGTTQRVICLSGRGNGSKHLYFWSKTPVSPARLSQSSLKTKVLMPSVKPSKTDLSKLTTSEIASGMRFRAAWEISLMGEGQQVVLPPSIHPDSKKSYRWKSTDSFGSIPMLPKALGSAPTAVSPVSSRAQFSLSDVDLIGDPRLKGQDSLVDLILSGDGCADRSASLFTVSKKLARLGFNENEILTILSDRDTYLGQCAYDHTDSSDRSRAVHWLRRYTVDKGSSEVRAERRAVEDLLEDIEDETAKEEVKRLTIPFAHEDFDWHSKIERTGKDGAGPPRSSLKNVVLILSHAVGKDLFRRDLFRNRDSYGITTPWEGKPGVAIRDTDVNLIRHWLAQHWRFEPAQNFVVDAIDVMAEWNGFHPVRDYLNGLPEWDGEERLAIWLKKNLGAVGPSHYLSEVFTKWMVAAVKRIFEPGAQFDWMMVLEGNEGIGKSTFFRDLAGADFFRDNLPDLADKDAAQALDGIWIVEMPEVENYLKKNAREVFKAYLARRIDKYRPPYGKKMIEAHRQCVFTGSTNEERYLYNDAENRRVTPVVLQPGAKINWDANKKWRNQLWAEALVVYRLGLFDTTLELEGESKIYASRLRKQEKQILTDADLMAEVLVDWRKDLAPEGEERWDFERLSLRELFDQEKGGPLTRWRLEIKNMMLAGRALKLLGATKKEVNGRGFWSWKSGRYLGSEGTYKQPEVPTSQKRPW